MSFFCFDTRRAAALLTAVFLCVAARPLDDFEITGTILYGDAAGATSGADCDHTSAFAEAPAEIHRRELGLPADSGEGKALFVRAQTSWRKALARVAVDEGVDVITVTGGCRGGDGPIVDVTQRVIDSLPKYYVHGEVLHGRAQDAGDIAVLDKQALLDAIPEYLEFLRVDSTNPRYHLLQRAYRDKFTAAVHTAARDGGHDCVVQVGGVTTRLDALSEITRAAIDALDS